MNRKELYEKSVNTLLDAYNSGQLEYGNCEKCAVGNMLGTHYWGVLFQTGDYEGKALQKEYSLPECLKGKFYLSTIMLEVRVMARNAIRKSGYTKRELMKVEYAFESSVIGQGELSEKKKQFMGLTAVLDVLKDIHSTPDKESKKSRDKLKNIFESKKELV